MYPKTSVIVTTYNQKERLALVLDSLLCQSVQPLEILIADDGSREDTRALIEQYIASASTKILHVWQEDMGFRLSEIRNKALQQASGEYVIFLDGDMIVHRDFVRDHITFARQNVLLQGIRVLLDEEKTQAILKKKDFSLAFQTFALKAFRILFLAHQIYQKKHYNKSHLNLTKFLPIRGCNMSFFKKDAEKINGFNEDFRGWGREDSEFVARFLYAGGEVRYLKFAGIAYHLYHQENSRDMLAQNHAIYEDCIKNGHTTCANGLKKTNLF
ncbi:lipooligosaccharide glycosyltransferase [Helicobacter mustelae]|uniref:glycosyltransferase family 2 protein n=1 Tax=Helicobacter mustelae TaxID=217 RepID=UPI000E00AE07|nr:glycosyltransferase family 2 protein [Helicobacter mustelae]STP11987.1 lipooligosaccharide glycosyltransferase [Helicobacter mustelae]